MSTKLKRITTQYIPFEDRIRLTGSDQGSGTLTLWLTQRLLNRMVVPLCEGLEKQTTPAVKSASGPSIPSVQAHLVQTFAQQKAAAALPKDGPVVTAPESPVWLVATVLIKHTPDSVRLTFKGSDEVQRAELTLTLFELRQWLGIVYKQFQSAAWPTQLWPAWVEEATKPTEPLPLTALH